MTGNDRLVKLIRSIPFSKDEYIQNSFWSPRLITIQSDGAYPGKHYGYTLYIYGGHAIDLYWVEDKEIIYGNAFSNSYFKYFDNKEIAKKIAKEFNEKIKEGAEFLKGWDNWSNIFKAFAARGFGERKRENRILCKNSNMGGEVEVFVMEYTTNINDVEAKADLVWLTYDTNNSPVFSLVEYKCTDAAVKKGSGYNLTDHFSKMVDYYDLDEVKESLRKLLNMKRNLMGEPILEARLSDINMSFGFYFTHINPTRNKIYDKGISEGNVKRRIYEMIEDNKEKYIQHIKDIFFIFGDNEDTKLALSRRINALDVRCENENEVWDSIRAAAI